MEFVIILPESRFFALRWSLASILSVSISWDWRSSTWCWYLQYMLGKFNLQPACLRRGRKADERYEYRGALEAYTTGLIAMQAVINKGVLTPRYLLTGLFFDLYRNFFEPQFECSRKCLIANVLLQ
jgi:hypothetical protein